MMKRLACFLAGLAALFLAFTLAVQASPEEKTEKRVEKKVIAVTGGEGLDAETLKTLEALGVHVEELKGYPGVKCIVIKTDGDGSGEEDFMVMNGGAFGWPGGGKPGCGKGGPGAMSLNWDDGDGGGFMKKLCGPMSGRPGCGKTGLAAMLCGMDSGCGGDCLKISWCAGTGDEKESFVRAEGCCGGGGKRVAVAFTNPDGRKDSVGEDSCGDSGCFSLCFRARPGSEAVLSCDGKELSRFKVPEGK